MATPAERQADFIERLEEIGISSQTVSIINQKENPDRVNIEIGHHSLLSSGIVQHAVMGMIAHFINRKWAKGWNYTYIMKSHHSITFTNESD
jgi:hypothetical protein